jgi:meso-butanediol dehydrogenase/(S,S)-butanediol dehydrogenase/diacetyl reductase
MGRLDGRVAVVTGAGQGVGRGIAIALAKEGASLALAGRTESKLLAVAEEIEALGVPTQTVVVDVKDPASLTAMIDAVVGRFGTIDVLVNNAQQSSLGTLLEVTEESFTDCWNSGPLATFRLMRMCHPYLRGNGVIINLGSSTSVNPLPVARGVYAAAKAAVTALTRTAAVEWGVDGIRAITVMPAVASEAAIAFQQAEPEAWQRSQESIPLRRLGEAVTEIGATVAFLCSDDASYITGTVVSIDGGQAYLR